MQAVAGVGAFFASIPFVKSFLPSARARALANPINVDVSLLAPGEVRAYLYRGETMLVLRRTPAMLATLASTDARLLERTPDPEHLDPPYVDPEHRGIRPEYLVVRGVCTHLGCVPIERDEASGRPIVGEDWVGGFICPCHFSGYDYAGRVIRGPAPRNLDVPPHRYTSAAHLVIGEAPPVT